MTLGSVGIGTTKPWRVSDQYIDHALGMDCDSSCVEGLAWTPITPESYLLFTEATSRASVHHEEVDRLLPIRSPLHEHWHLLGRIKSSIGSWQTPCSSTFLSNVLFCFGGSVACFFVYAFCRLLPKAERWPFLWKVGLAQRMSCWS